MEGVEQRKKTDYCPFVTIFKSFTGNVMPNQRASKLPTTNRGRHYIQRTRDRIESTAIIKKLHQHVMGEIDMTPSQIASAKLLLDRTVPPLKPAENAPQVDAVGGLQSLPTSQLHALLLEVTHARSRFHYGWNSNFGSPKPGR